MSNGLVSLLECIRYTQVLQEWSSTMVTKYLWPSKVDTKYGPQMSQCIRSKLLVLMWLALGKDNLFCLARGQLSQKEVLLLIVGKFCTWCRKNNLSKEECPNL